MRSEFEQLLRQYSQILSAGRPIFPDKHLIGGPVRIDKFSYQPLVEVTKEPRFYPEVNVWSQIGSLLQLKVDNPDDPDGPFVELVNNAKAQEIFKTYFIMGFLTPHDRFVGPRDAVNRAETEEYHAGGGFRNRLGDGGGGLPDTPGELSNGLWHHIPTATEFIINDTKYRSGAPGHGDVADAPILALGNNLPRTLAVSTETDAWYEEYPPPAAPRNRAMDNAYVRSLRSYLKKMAIQLIERDNWFLLWHGYLYTNGQGLNFEAVVEHSPILRRNVINWPDGVTITELDANNASFESNRYTWGDLKTAKNTRLLGHGGGRGRYGSFYDHFQKLGTELRKNFPHLFPRTARTAWVEDIELTGDLLHALVEGRLDESLTYNQMLTATASYWQTRLKTVRNVRTKPPGLVMLKDGTVDLSFDFVSVPSTTGRPHQGYIKFVPERGQPKLIDKLKDFLGRIGQQIKKFIGKKVPPRALKGSDLRKMLCEVSCSCPDFKYRMSYANVKQGVTTQAGRTDNGRAPVKTNPARRPGFCKHILATLRYLTDDAEIQISKELSVQQQEALKKDRAQFYKEAEISYEKMKAPAAKGAEKIKPEEEPAPSPEFAKLPAPPKPELAPKPLMPVTAPAPPTPNYLSNQG